MEFNFLIESKKVKVLGDPIIQFSRLRGRIERGALLKLITMGLKNQL